MTISRKRWLWVGLGGLLGIVVLAAVAWVWVVPAVIVGQIRAQYAGEVSIGGWWLGPDSAGVTGLVLHEGAGADRRSGPGSIGSRRTCPSAA